ncbi:MAG: hypothetical protein ABI388_04610 [Bacteroidia bacterium]
MKITLKTTLVIFALATSIIACKKKDTTPTPVITQPAPAQSSCTYTLNNTTVMTTDSMHWDLYNGTTNRVQAYIGSKVVITLWPTSVTTHTQTLTQQYVYWFDGNTVIYTPGTGSLTLNNASNVLSGTITATGNVWTGSGGAPTSTISAVFSNVKKVGS